MAHSPPGFRDRYLYHLIFLSLAITLVALYWYSTKLRFEGGFFAPNFVRLFDLNGESNVPSWYSSSLWLIAAAQCAWIFKESRRLDILSDVRPFWLLLGFASLFMSLDEAAVVHETVGNYFDYRANDPAGVQPVYRWVWLALGAIFVALIPIFLMLTRLPNDVAVRLCLSGAIFLSGALGLETLGSMVQSGAVAGFPLGLNWNRLIALEEFLEMLGVISFSAAIRDYNTRCVRAPAGSANCGGDYRRLR